MRLFQKNDEKLVAKSNLMLLGYNSQFVLLYKAVAGLGGCVLDDGIGAKAKIYLLDSYQTLNSSKR